jgi:YHS domain-containing protein
MSFLRIFFGASFVAWLILSGGGCRCEDSSSGARARPVPGEVTVRCPVCGLEFDGTESVGSFEYQGQVYYFLLQDHLDAFRKNPQDYTVPGTGVEPEHAQAAE